ncbi:hypothetical protein [Carboxylicivirga sp. N1Y90]|uniref:hypothetical protein n=1 Tax=Carboxylicivirga fragile TaxID=3417571 RepID=UPI003D328A6F|nr:hypothetical protein [Marinilabiliaceae bacterium N1Y90]
MNWSIEELIPQRSPFVFVDRVIDFTDISVQSEYVVKKNNPLVENGCMAESGLIENMAQTAAALEGCNAKKNNKAVKIGFIGSVKNLEINKQVVVGDVLLTNVEIVNTALGVNIAEGHVSCNGEAVAKCVLNIFLKED